MKKKVPAWEIDTEKWPEALASGWGSHVETNPAIGRLSDYMDESLSPAEEEKLLKMIKEQLPYHFDMFYHRMMGLMEAVSNPDTAVTMGEDYLGPCLEEALMWLGARFDPSLIKETFTLREAE